MNQVLSLWPNRIQQRRQPVASPRNSLVNNLQRFLLVTGRRLATVCYPFISHGLRELKAFVCPAAEVKRIFEIHSAGSGGISCLRSGGGRGNLFEWRRREIWSRRRKGANATVPITMEVGFF